MRGSLTHACTHKRKLRHRRPLPRLLAGVRLLPQCILGFIFQLPPIATLLTQSAMTLLTANSAAYCTTPVGLAAALRGPGAATSPWRCHWHAACTALARSDARPGM